MDRDALRTVAIAVLAVLVIAFAAATLNSTVQSDAGGDGISNNQPPRDGAGGGEGEGILPGEGREGNDLGEGRISTGFCIQLLSDPAAGWGFLALLICVYFVLRWREFDRLSSVALVVTPAVPIILIWMVLISGCPSSTPAEVLTPGNFSLIPGEETSDFGSGGVMGEGGDGSNPSTPSVLLFAVLALGLVGVVVALFYSDRSSDADEEADPDPDLTEDEQRAAVAAAAGRAADRIEAAEDVENEVYRAWAEMTRHLDVSRPETSTPAEFAAAATDAGMSPDDVNELTGLFEDVRYGGKEATADREQRAVDALRRIEETYGGDAP